MLIERVFAYSASPKIEVDLTREQSWSKTLEVLVPELVHQSSRSQNLSSIIPRFIRSPIPNSAGAQNFVTRSRIVVKAERATRSTILFLCLFPSIVYIGLNWHYDKWLGNEVGKQERLIPVTDLTIFLPWYLGEKVSQWKCSEEPRPAGDGWLDVRVSRVFITGFDLFLWTRLFYVMRLLYAAFRESDDQR